MIALPRYTEILRQMLTEVNASLQGAGIVHLVFAATENQAQKKIADKAGIILVAQLPSSLSDIETVDHFSEDNRFLLFLVEKREPSGYKDQDELDHYARLQTIMRACKTWLLNHGLLAGEQDGSETLQKPFRTEWEYQIFGHFNGLSLSFEYKDFDL